MTPIYLIFGAHGWRSRTGQYTTDIKQAAEFTHDEMKEIILAHKSDGSYPLVPVRRSDLP